MVPKLLHGRRADQEAPAGSRELSRTRPADRTTPRGRSRISIDGSGTRFALAPSWHPASLKIAFGNILHGRLGILASRFDNVVKTVPADRTNRPLTYPFCHGDRAEAASASFSGLDMETFPKIRLGQQRFIDLKIQSQTKLNRHLITDFNCFYSVHFQPWQ
jgi:hypothetical protein